MKITDIFLLLGGLALFLYGMHIMGEGLELVAGNQLKRILEKLTTNRFMGMLVGLVTTAIIQSSSATTVMLVGFVNAKLMNLTQAVGVIMGANIGTTVTAQLIALDIKLIAPVIAFLGIIFVLFSKKKKTNYIGQILVGLGMLFIGMGSMSDAMSPLRDIPEFRQFMTNFSNPFMGILAGTVFTSLIQSSSASVGILQALAAQGLLGIDGAMYVVFGQNIGTCITSLLSSIGTNKNAKRVATCHVLFNVIGTIIFVVVSFMLPLDEWMIALAPGDVVKQIANLHTVFNLSVTLLLLPFSNQLAKLSTLIIKGEDSVEDGMKLEFIETGKFLDSNISIANVEAELNRMISLSKNNLELAMSEFNNPDKNMLGKVNYQEEIINFLHREIIKSIVKTNSMPLAESSAAQLNHFYIITNNLERIADHTQNIAEHVQHCQERKFIFSSKGLEELNLMKKTVLNMFGIAMDKNLTHGERHEKVYMLEEQVDNYTTKFKENHIDRMAKGDCDFETGIVYDEMLTDLERIADHLMNIAEA
ncbi:phosphate:Na+ symporter [Mobilisporobacter senegalensis]|uniref:Phosphate:Na+ symporter n=1 Tax=Mobilisporobacter senegalensis TaxID=1329262 RepID=A0A3N1XKN1_9FIRM|nr:Na/Pi cotransporter family protein [Mobilisporobacter senegalensis]ROR27269.1 phosphate:Na+ symporter [Mobilisporobacter senegalensis]